MKLYISNDMKYTFLTFIVMILLGGCTYINMRLGLPNDNPIEQLIEDKIEERTGLDIDLTP